MDGWMNGWMDEWLQSQQNLGNLNNKRSHIPRVITIHKYILLYSQDTLTTKL